MGEFRLLIGACKILCAEGSKEGGGGEGGVRF